MAASDEAFSVSQAISVSEGGSESASRRLFDGGSENIVKRKQSKYPAARKRMHEGRS